MSLPFVLFVSAIALLAQANSPFTGKWELNVAKSKFSPGPKPQSETVTNIDGKTTVEGVDSDGKSFKWSFTPSQGAVVPIEGMDNSSVEEKISGKAIDHDWKLAGGSMHGHGVLSKGDKVLRYTEEGTDGQGRPVHNVFFFEKR
jgi:hypothetical protein